MEQSFSDSDVSMSPTKIFDRLQVLRQLMLFQREKLQKQGLQYQESPETTSNEFFSHFSNSTSYNTFKSLLESSHETTNKISPKNNKVNVNPIISKQDLLDGVSVLNISQESELIINSPASSNSCATSSKTNMISEKLNNIIDSKTQSKKQISLDEMPILSPKENFEALIIEKLQQELNAPVVNIPNKKENKQKQTKNTFLKRGEGMARFGVHKNDFVIQNTKSLPWRQKSMANKREQPQVLRKSKNNNKVKVKFSVNKEKGKQENLNTNSTEKNTTKKSPEQDENADVSVSNNSKIDTIEQCKKVNKPEKQNHPVLGFKAKTWAAVLTKEQDDFLHQLKQSDYYKNFASPAKSTISDISCDDFFSRNKLNKEMADQKMFELLENKVSEENFHLENSFFSRFLGRTKLETSGESTPLVLRKCLTENPELMCIFPNVNNKKNDHFDSHNKSSEVCDVCCSEECSSVCSECSCQTVETNHSPIKIKTKNIKNTGHKNPVNDVDESEDKNNTCHNDTITENNIIKANMADMNAKLIATSDLLKERLGELEDEIETFRKENANLNKLRDEMDLERQKFYEDKAALEQKLNEEKILQEYYLSEEKEKISKQRQTYEKYIREMRLKVNKKEKDDVLNLKKEINDLKEDIRLKDAKYTSTIARLRNQIKIMEKEKKDFQEEIEKLKKENRRIQHSNDITRRLSNIKYLEEINRKLSNLNTRETMSEVNVDKDIKYKAYEIERQSRVRKVQPSFKKNPRPRAKSAPNLNVTSRYAKYFSQRDATSQVGGNTTLHNDFVGTNAYSSDDEIIEENYGREIDDINDHSVNVNELSNNDEENNLEKLYLERFHSTSARRSNFSDVCSTYSDESESRNAMNSQKSSFSLNTAKNATSINERSTFPKRKTTMSNSSRSVSPVSILSNKNNCKSSNSNNSYSNFVAPSGWNRSESPISSSKRSQSPVVQSNAYLKANDKMIPSPEPSTSNTSLTKTNLNPTEIKKPDGSKELRFPNGNIKYISADGQYGKFLYYNGDIKETFYNEGRTKYFYAELKTFHTTHPDGLEVLEFPDGQVEKRYKDGSLEVRLPNGSIRYFDPKNEHVREEWRFPDGTALTVAANGERRIVFPSGQVEVHAVDHKRREYPDGTVKLVYNDGTAETRYASGRVRIKDQHGNLIMDSASR